MLIAQYKEANSFKDLSPSCMKDRRYHNAIQIHNVLVSSRFGHSQMELQKCVAFQQN